VRPDWFVVVDGRQGALGFVRGGAIEGAGCWRSRGIDLGEGSGAGLASELQGWGGRRGWAGSPVSGGARDCWGERGTGNDIGPFGFLEKKGVISFRQRRAK
jgi:hypothetical protein